MLIVFLLCVMIRIASLTAHLHQFREAPMLASSKRRVHFVEMPNGLGVYWKMRRAMRARLAPSRRLRAATRSAGASQEARDHINAALGRILFVGELHKCMTAAESFLNVVWKFH